MILLYVLVVIKMFIFVNEWNVYKKLDGVKTISYKYYTSKTKKIQGKSRKLRYTNLREKEEYKEDIAYEV